MSALSSASGDNQKVDGVRALNGFARFGKPKSWHACFIHESLTGLNRVVTVPREDGSFLHMVLPASDVRRKTEPV